MSSSSASEARAPHCWIDGRLVPQAHAAIPVSDLIITRGYGAFEALRTYGGRTPFLLGPHLARLEESCRQLDLPLPATRAQIEKIVLDTIACNDFAESLVRIYVTGGDSNAFALGPRPRLLVLVDELKPFPAQQYDNGIAVRTTALARTLPAVKSTGYLAGLRETTRARKAQFDEVVYTDADGALLEGTTFNLLGVSDQCLILPEGEMLAGITLGHIISIARKMSISVRQQRLTRSVVDQLDELIATSSIREVIPVVRINDQAIGDGRPGPRARRLHQWYRESALLACSGNEASARPLNFAWRTGP